jgi:hypothetical protein
MTNDAVHVSPTAPAFAPAAASFGARHKRGFIIAAIVGLLLTLVGALNTGPLPFLSRLAYWEILMLSGTMIGLGVSESVEKWGRLRTKPAIEILIIAILIALPLTFMVVGTGSLFFPAKPPSPMAVFFMFGITLAISLAMTTLNYLIYWPAMRPAPEAPVAQGATGHSTAPETTRFAQRLPLPMRNTKIIALQAEDHYLRVHLDDGRSTLILMRLSDAIAELPVELGAQTHRSWWVAKEAVRGVTKAEGRATLALRESLEAPVSRSFYKMLNDAGWLN